MNFQALLLLCLVAGAQPGFAQTEETTSSWSRKAIFDLDSKNLNNPRKSIFWAPVASYLLPGINQYINDQNRAGALYSALAVTGLMTASQASQRIQGRVENPRDIVNLEERDSDVRAYLWGMKTYDLAGSLSLYHTFRTAVNFRKGRGDYSFLPEGERVDELMLAPFQFSFLTRWSTLIPLGIGLGLVIGVSANDDYNTRSLDGEDVLFTGAISYNAGVGEEALFRGWMMPLFRESFGNSFWSNIATSTLFAAAHISSENPYPVAQFVAGYYLGWLTLQNNWTLSESIFVHTWWDIIIFAANFSQGDRKASIYVPIYQTQF
ncbi:MAG: CPBP family intramembrane metalloprotease [Bdellovibrionales bacterium]|nr:CPBP family intramembrane metalloprotease [Bdellovibrionales bacterium]